MRLVHRALARLQQLVPAVSADVREGVQLAVGPAHEQHAFDHRFDRLCVPASATSDERPTQTQESVKKCGVSQSHSSEEV